MSVNSPFRDTMPVPLKILLRILAVVAVGIARIIAAIAQVFAEVFGIVAYEVLVPVVAVLQEAEERLTRTSEDGRVITEADEPHNTLKRREKMRLLCLHLTVALLAFLYAPHSDLPHWVFYAMAAVNGGVVVGALVKIVLNGLSAD